MSVKNNKREYVFDNEEFITNSIKNKKFSKKSRSIYEFKSVWKIGLFLIVMGIILYVLGNQLKQANDIFHVLSRIFFSLGIIVFVIKILTKIIVFVSGYVTHVLTRFAIICITFGATLVTDLGKYFSVSYIIKDVLFILSGSAIIVRIFILFFKKDKY